MKRLWVRLFTIIGTFSKNLKCLLERFLVCWRILKNLFKDTRVIWSSAGRILVSRSRSLAVSYLVLIKQTFIPQFICLLILSDLFRLCPPSLVGAYYLQPPDARAIFLHNDLLCNDTCSVTGGSITYWGGHKRKRSILSIE